MPDGSRDPRPRLHLVKLCVGAESIADLAAWQARPEAQAVMASGGRRPVHVTRMWPRRADELLSGGSLFWVIRGAIAVRQRIAALEPVTDADGIGRCAILLDPTLVQVAARPKRPFQGWRYLKVEDAPPDLGSVEGEDGGLPADLREAMQRFGLRERVRA
ncbi:MAG: DUF1489 family protein [Paracoccaceae bacterium]